MNRQIILHVILFIMGAISAFLNGWVFLLEPDNTRALLLAGLGILLMISAVVNVRRQLQQNR